VDTSNTKEGGRNCVGARNAMLKGNRAMSIRTTSVRIKCNSLNCQRALKCSGSAGGPGF
jgi:hypothetical protein